MYAFLLLEGVLNRDLACLVSMHVLLSVKTKALEGRYRREVVRLLMGNTLYFIDLLGEEDGARTPEGLHRFAVDDQEYLPTTCAVPAGAKIFPIYQSHTGKVHTPLSGKSGYTHVVDTPPHPPIPWHRISLTDRPWPHSPERRAKESWGVYDD